MSVRAVDTNGHKPTVISLFAGCGGSSLGYKWAGFKELLAIDFDKNAVETFKLNFPDVPIWQRDICKVTADEIMEFCKIEKGKLDVLDGSPPCQGFSTAGKRKVRDKRNDLFKEFVRLIEGLQPKAFIMENVSGMVKGRMKGRFIEVMEVLKQTDYNVQCKLLNAMYYEVPQSRQRLVWLGHQKEKLTFPNASKRILTVRNAIEGLSVNQNESINHIWNDESPKGKNTKTWYLADKTRQGCKYAKRQKRYTWNKPAGTLQTPGGSLKISAYLRNSGCHPLHTRTFSIREFARLQTFPDEYKLQNDLCYDYKVIGNSVPPKFMQAIAESVKRQLK